MYVKKSFMTTAVHPPFTGSLKFMQRPFGPSVRTVFVQQMRQFRQQLLCRYRWQPVSVTMSTVRTPAETPFSLNFFYTCPEPVLANRSVLKTRKWRQKAPWFRTSRRLLPNAAAADGPAGDADNVVVNLSAQSREPALLPSAPGQLPQDLR